MDTQDPANVQPVEPVVVTENTTDTVIPAATKISLRQRVRGLIGQISEKCRQLSARFESRKKRVAALLVVMLCVVAAGTYYYFNDRHVAVKQFTNVYSFVPEKISKSAAIQINLPKGVTEEVARNSISFSPKIDGEWQTEALDQILTYKPKDPLKVGVYYAVNMDTGSVKMSGDFYVDEDPKIENIFPVAGSEAHEDSEITIVFNRPMVPLTTLTAQESLELPIKISPQTPGKFKWVSTRNLQFIPETTLIPSSQYTVEIGSGLYSLDGLAIDPVQHTFMTRPLRYEHMSEDSVGYRSPIIIGFNQPVDLEWTKDKISIESNGKKVAFDVTYGDVSYYDRETKTHKKREDKSKLFVYQKKDTHGREHLWDFNTTYAVSIRGARPIAGTVALQESRSAAIQVPNIVASVNAASERTTLVREDFVDPQGTVSVEFYDDIDLSKSDINVKGLSGIQYGERCRLDDEGYPVYKGSSCIKEQDTKTIILSFNHDAFGKSESFNIELNKIYTKEGFKINAEPLSLPLKTYSDFAILRTVPGNGATNADIDGISICSTAPLQDPGEAGVAAYVQTSGYVVFGHWSASRYIYNKESYDDCGSGEFETRIAYGLLPETDYALTLNLTDVFGQQGSSQVSFKTSPPQSQYTRFHNIQQQYNVTTPDKTKFTYAVENLEYVDMHVCKMSPELFLERIVKQDEQYTPPRSDGCSEVVTKQISLPVRYWVLNYFQLNLADYFTDTRGQYIVTFSNPLYKSEYDSKQLYDRTYVSVTNLAVGKKEVAYEKSYWDEEGDSDNPKEDAVLEKKLAAANNIYWVTQVKTLEPVGGALVTQYQGGYDINFEKRNSGATGGEGIAALRVERDVAGAVITSGADTAVVTDWADSLSGASSVYDASKTYVYTDRPIYRPGHTVHIRGIDRIGFDGSYEVLENEKVPIQVFDPMGTRIYETTLVQSAYGTFSTDFDLPADAALGTYRIEAYRDSFYFDVEEYVPAAFKLEATTDKEEYVNGDVFKLDVQADYYFGVPIDEGTLSYSVTAQDYYFDKYTDEYFNFGGGWYYCYSCGYGDNYLFRGEVPFDARGHATIEQALKLDEFFENVDEEGSKLVTVSLTAKDINGRSVSSQKSFVVHKGEYYLGVKTDEYYTGTNAPNKIRVKTVDTTGKPIDVSGLERIVYKVDWETFKRQEVDGGFYYKSEKKLTEVSREKIKTNNSGDWSGDLMLTAEGEYEIHVQGTDSKGNNLKTTTYVYVYGTNSVTVPPNNNYELDLEAEKTSLDVGETASLLIKSPYPKAKALIAVERGTVYDYWIVDVVGGLYEHTFPVKSEYAPNIYVSVLLMSPDPEVKYGSMDYIIGTKEKTLDVEVTANKTHYLPGEEVTLQVKTQNSQGQGIQAEVSIAVADLSVLALKGNPKKNPLVFFYDGFPLSVTTASNIKNMLHEVDVPLGTKGGSGGEPDDLAKKKRGVFRDTAFWQASVVTNQDGDATVTFTLPDNLTTWQVESLGVTKETTLGVDYKEFTTKKDLMAVPLKPRFVIPGDTFFLGAKIFNQTSRDSKIRVSLESPTLSFLGSKDDSVSVKAGESETVYFEVKAPGDKRRGDHTFTFTASDESFTDIVEQTIKITPPTTYETVATANATKDDSSVEYIYVPEVVIPGEGGLTINANATMAVFMTDALTYMATYPYGCSEQLASSLSTIGILTTALDLPNVEGDFDTITHEGVTYTVDEVVKEGLTNIYETQTIEGGFAYYKGLDAQLSLTIHVASALYDLKRAGFEIRQDVLDRALVYIEARAQNLYREYPESYKETVIHAESVLRKVAPEKKTALTDIVVSFIKDDAFLNEKMSSQSLALLARLTVKEYSRSDRNRVYDAFVNRIDIDGRGAYLKSNGSWDYDFYETSITNTALALSAFVAHEDEHETLPNMLRWLLASRDSDGVWGNTHNTFIVVQAMVEYLNWQHEAESEFTLKGLLDGVEIFTFDFNPKTVFQTFTHFVGMDSLPKETLIPVTLQKEDTNNRENNLYYDMALKYYLPVDTLPPRDEGITITRELFALDDTKDATVIHTATVGDVVRGKITITVPAEYKHVAVEDYIPAGFELVNFNLNTEDQTLREDADADIYEYGAASSGDEHATAWVLDSVTGIFGGSQVAQLYDWYGFREYDFGGTDGGAKRNLYPTHTESHDDRVFLYVESLSPGVYEYEYYLRALVPGTFQHMPARAEELYFPEVFGRSTGDIVTVTEE